MHLQCRIMGVGIGAHVPDMIGWYHSAFSLRHGHGPHIVFEGDFCPL